MQTFHPRYLLRIRPIPSILAGCSLIPLRKLHLESHFQQLFTKLPSLKLFHPDGRTADKFSLEWKEFYTRARAIHNKGSCGDLKKLSKEPVDLFNASHTTLNAIDETFKKMEKDEPYNFPEIMTQRYTQHARPSATPFRKPVEPRRSMTLLK